ncbi:MAG: phosphate uptake regulator PhoU [Thaumarchaeota archaeon]|nr:phosphate uptake regulator PhoU [Nitrososphaerota archaeon]
MDTRKVLEMGGGTVLISLPKEWARRNKVARGASVLVEEISPGRLMVSPVGPEGQPAKTTVIEYPREDISYVVNDLTGAYLIGSNVIRVEGKQTIGREDRERIKGMTRRLVGLEIMDEDSKSLTLHFLPEPSTLDPEKIVRRMGNLTRGMLKDAREALREEDSKVMALIAERDDEVDRLYFLLVRAIRTATIDPELAQRYGLTPVECLDYRVLASFLEGLGDTIAEFSKRAATEPPSGAPATEISEVFRVLEDMEELSVRTFLERKQGRSRSGYLEIDVMKRRVDDSLRRITETRGVSTGLIVDLLSMVERIAKTFVDISDLSLPTYQFTDAPQSKKKGSKG